MYMIVTVLNFVQRAVVYQKMLLFISFLRFKKIRVIRRGDNKPVEVSHSDFSVIVLVPGYKSASADDDIQGPFLLFFKTGGDEGNVFSIL